MSPKIFCCVFLAFLAFANAAPLIGEQSKQCSTKCSESNNFFYEIGKTYNYDFDTKNELKFGDRNVVARLSGTAKLNYAKKCEFRLKLENVKVEGLPSKELRAKHLEMETLTFAFDDGKITNVCPSINERSDVLNVKKAILSAFQVSVKELGTKKMVEERDVTGDCETVYEEMNAFEKQSEGTKLMKKKNLNTCRNRIHANTILFQNSLLQRILEKSSDSINNEQVCYQYIDNDGILKSVDCRESSHLRQYSHESSLSIKYINTDNSMIREPETFRKQSLLYSADQHKMDTSNPYKLLKSLCESVVDEMSEQTPALFSKFTHAVKHMDYNQVMKMVNRVRNEGGIDGCVSKKLKGLLESSLLMSSGSGALQYITENIKTFDTEDPKKMMTLMSLPFMTNPNEGTVKSMLPVMKNIRSPKILLLISALIGNYVRRNNPMVEPVNEAVNVLATRLPAKCNANEMKNEETVTILKAMGNVGYASSEIVQKLIGCAKSSATATNIRVAALDTLRRAGACKDAGELDSDMNLLLDMLRTRTEESDEIKIAAYKVFMSCSDSFGEQFVVDQSMKILRQENNKRLAHYVYSYLMNIKKSKNPSQEELRSVIMDTEIRFDPSHSSEKYSKNVLHSFYSKKLQMGIHAEMDLIYESGMKNPKSVVMSVYVPIHNKNVQIFEIGLRQETDDNSLTTVIELLKEQNMDNWKQMISSMLLVKMPTGVDMYDGMEKLDKAISRLFKSIDHLSFYINYNENTLFLEDYNSMERLQRHKRDLMIQNVPGIFREMSQIPITSHLKSMLKESAFGLFLMDSSMEMPTISGFPIMFSAKGIVTSGRNDVRDFSTVDLLPNFSVGICFSAKTFINREEKIGIKWKMTAMSNLRVFLKIGNEHKEKSVELSLPKEKSDLLKLSAKMLIDTEFGEKIISDESRHYETCGPEMVGLRMCEIHGFSSLFDFMKEQNFRISFHRTDNEIKSWKAAIQIPDTQNDRLYVHFSTPGSRKHFFDMEIKGIVADDEWIQYDYKYETTTKKMNGHIAYRALNDKFQMRFENSDKHYYEWWIQSDMKPQSMGIITKFIAKNPFMEPLEKDCSLMYKFDDSSISFDMNSDLKIGEKHFKLLHAKWSMSGDKNINFVFHVGERRLNRWIHWNSYIQQLNILKIDANVDYKTKQMTKSMGFNINGFYMDNGNIQMKIYRMEKKDEIASFEWNDDKLLFKIETVDLKHLTEMRRTSRSLEAKTETKMNGIMLMSGDMKREGHEMKKFNFDVPNHFSLYYEVTHDNGCKFKLSHKKWNFEHETSYSKNDEKSEIDFRSQTFQNSNEIHDIKLYGKYESRNKYDLQTSFHVMKRLRFDLSAKSSGEDKDFSVGLMDSLISQEKPISYEMRALRSKRSSEVHVADGEGAYSLKAFKSEEKGIVIEYSAPDGKISFGLHGREFHLKAECKHDGKTDEHETSLKLIGKESTEFVSRTKKNDGREYYFKRVATPKSRSYSYESPHCYGNMTLEVLEGKHKKISGDYYNKVRKDGFKYELSADEKDGKEEYTLKYNADHGDLEKGYILNVHIPKKSAPHFEATFDSKGYGCVCDGKVDVHDLDYDIKYNKKCQEHSYAIHTKRTVTPLEYTHVFDLKQDADKYFNIETKGKRSPDGKTTTIKSQVKSSEKSYDGAYFDYKRVSDNPSKDNYTTAIDLAFKPVILDFIFTASAKGSVFLVGKWLKLPRDIQMHAEAKLDVHKQAVIYLYNVDIESSPQIFDWTSKLAKEENKKTEIIRTRTLHVDHKNDIAYFDYVYKPTNSMFNISLNTADKNDRKISILWICHNNKVIQVDGEVKITDGKVEETSQGEVLGFPFKRREVFIANKHTVEMSVHPMVPNYAYPIPERYRHSDCYEPSEGPCIWYTFDFDRKNKRLHSLDSKIKVNSHGEKYTAFIKYENKDEEGVKKERILSIKSDKNDKQRGYHLLQQFGKENAKCDFKVFLNEGRVLRYLRESKGVESGHIDIWLDAERKPDRKFSIKEKFVKTPNGFDINFVVSHPVLKKPVTLDIDVAVDNPNNKFNVKAELDFSENPNNKVTLDFEQVQEKSAKGSNIFGDKKHTVKLYTADKRLDITHKQENIVNFTDVGSVLSSIKSTEWKSAINPNEVKSIVNSLEVKRIVEEHAIKLIKRYVYKRLSYYVEVDTEVINPEKGPSIRNLDIKLSENGPKYRFNASVEKEDNAECGVVNGFKVENDAPVGPKKYFKVCFPKNAPVKLHVMVGDESREKHTAWLIVESEQRDKILFTLRWDPERVKSRLFEIVEKINARIQHYERVEKELERERDALVKLVTDQIGKEVVAPLGEHVSKEVSDICKETPKVCKPFHYMADWATDSPRHDHDNHRMKRELPYANLHKFVPNAYRCVVEFRKFWESVDFEVKTFEPEKGEIIIEYRAKH